jgi:hypothetical protein
MLGSIEDTASPKSKSSVISARFPGRRPRSKLYLSSIDQTLKRQEQTVMLAGFHGFESRAF